MPGVQKFIAEYNEQADTPLLMTVKQDSRKIAVVVPNATSDKIKELEEIMKASGLNRIFFYFTSTNPEDDDDFYPSPEAHVAARVAAQVATGTAPKPPLAPRRQPVFA